MNIHLAIEAYRNSTDGENNRERSWDHCYKYFKATRSKKLVENIDHASLQLGFFLASWGMYRGSSFLLKYSYTVHRCVINLIAESRFDHLWEIDFGTGETDTRFIPCIRELIDGIQQAYKPYQPTDTLITKIILGTLGCLPALDQYFINGFRHSGLKYSNLNEKLLKSLIEFCQSNLTELRKEQEISENISGIRYPFMKLIDMYFWQIGYKNNPGSLVK